MGKISGTPQCVVVKYNGEQIVLKPWGKNSIRIQAVPNGKISSTVNALDDFAHEISGEAPLLDLGETRTTITNGKLRVLIEIEEWTKRPVLSFFNQKGELLFREMPGSGALDLYPRKWKAVSGGDYRLTACFEADPEEKLFGMGQYQQEIYDIKNCSFELAHRNSQASVPFVLSSKGYGFLWNNPAIGRAVFSKNRTEWEAYSTRQLDYWVTAGDTPAEIEQQYAKVTGTVPMMPEYGLGFWQSKLRYVTQEELLHVAREYKKRELPIDVIVCDFFHWPRMGDFRFDEKFYPDPAGMVKELKDMGIELMVSVWPQIDRCSENYDEMEENGYLMQVESGVHIAMEFGGYSMFYDATNPDARKYVWEKCKKNYYDQGIKVFWLDEAEPEYKNYDFDHYRYYAGSSAQIGNSYPMFYSKTFYEGMQEQGQQNIVNLVRCAWAGSQKYGALVWSGDIHSSFEDLRKQFYVGLHMGICGLPWWTTDIGGFAGGDPESEDFRELMIRWFEFGAFCPVMRLHGDRIPQTPVTGSDGQPAVPTGAGNEVWSFGEEACAILTKYLHVREGMREYIRELMKQAHEDGTPIMRTMFYEFPQDEKCWEVKGQYMFGSEYLVAPVLHAGMRKRSVYLPKGCNWTNQNTEEVFDGGQWIEVDTPINEIPVFVKIVKEMEINYGE